MISNFCSALIAGGGAPEIHVSRALSQYAHTLKGMEAYCFQAYADALEGPRPSSYHRAVVEGGDGT